MDKWNAKEYRKNSGNQYRWGMELAKKACIRKGENVLDIGCGDGKITAILAKYAGKGKVTGLDSSKAMISLAKELFPESGYANLRFVKKDAKNIGFKGVFDLAFSNACLHWIKDHRKVLSGVNKALKKGGRIFFQMGGKGNAGEINRIMTMMTKNIVWKSYFVDFKFPYFFPAPSEYKVLLKKAGLKPVKVFLVKKIAKHKGVDGLKAWIRTTWLPYTHCIPEAMRERFIDEAVESYISATKQEGKSMIRVPMMRLQVEAIKP